ncbi:SDR family NAD(P)-dependent oxidoreductase [Bordetella genomosp. 10]|uniref:SDR family NAD(P)-dependent oxidoreductase n=1 Tax=Bordetella genomosp. 10 TaxID=1416804 RepID=UPI001C52AFFE|nr:SDR family NAD(P)-dependent oxidoreductase [Bordetella genomosp. 10]
MSVEGRIAIVTGSSGGIGAATARALSEAGATVVGVDVREPAGKAMRCAAFHLADVRIPKTFRDVVSSVLEHHHRIDLLVNVAGVGSTGPSEGISEAEWDRVLEINLKGTFFCCQAVIPGMKKQGGGSIVNIGSVVGKNGGNARCWIDPDEQSGVSNAAYGAAKAGVHLLTAYLARELAASRIRVNAVAPGPIATPMTTVFPEALRSLIPVGRMGQLDDVANAVLFLADGRNSFITGEVLDVNGGIWCD